MRRLSSVLSSWIPIGVLAGMLFLGIFITPEDLPARTLCFFKAVLGVDCPGCGLTRAFLSLARGQVREAFFFNAASLLLYPYFAFLFFSALARKAFPRRVLQLPPRLHLIWANAVLTVLVAQWGVKLWRTDWSQIPLALTWERVNALLLLSPI